MKILLPEKHKIVRTSSEDPVEYFYVPVVRYPYLKRFDLALQLLDRYSGDTVLDIGYGCGAFLLNIAKNFNHLYGIDLHKENGKVKEMLERYNVKTNLVCGNLLSLPYEDNFFDCIICLSTLEHVGGLKTAISEMVRVMKDNGFSIIGFPVSSKVTEFFYKVTGSGDITAKHHISSDGVILSEIEKSMKIEKILFFRFLIKVYIVCKAKKS